jgi:hypothetical protein
VDDAAEIGPLLDQITGSLCSVTADGAYDQDGVYADVADRHPDAAVIVPPRCTAVLSEQSGDYANAARPSPPVHRREKPHGLAERVRLRQPRQGRGGDRRWKQVIGDGRPSTRDTVLPVKRWVLILGSG